MEGRDYRCSAVTNATFNHRECPRVRPSKKSPKWLRIERDVQASGMSKRASTQEVTTMILVTNATYFHLECPSVSARKKSPQ